jgi:uncharacterized FlaG/YvyC family protein
MYLYSVKSTLEIARGIDGISAVKTVPELPRTKQEPAESAPQRDARSEKLAKLQTVMSQHDISMKFSTNEQTNEVVVQLVNDKTGETIRQIPNEVSLKLAAVNIKLQGLILDQTV